MTCGQGHNMIAKALSEQFDLQGVENKIVQTFNYSQKQVEKENKKFYGFASISLIFMI